MVFASGWGSSSNATRAGGFGSLRLGAAIIAPHWLTAGAPEEACHPFAYPTLTRLGQPPRQLSNQLGCALAGVASPTARLAMPAETIFIAYIRVLGYKSLRIRAEPMIRRLQNQHNRGTGPMSPTPATRRPFSARSDVNRGSMNAQNCPLC
jgi:hypothetical protein